MFYRHTYWHLTKYYFCVQMEVIKRYATSSTNEEIKQIVQGKKITEPLCLYSKCQSDGKGQLGNRWSSEPYKNLTCSFYFNEIDIPVSKQFNLSVFVALAISKTLKELGLKETLIKWPNDILAGDHHKICGILTENTLSGSLIKSSIIGIGINVNQKKFPGLSGATSIALELGVDLQIDFVLRRLISNLEGLNKQSLLKIDLDRYYQKLYRYKETHHFKDKNGNIFKGKILGVTSNGYLRVYKLQEQQLEEYDVKEIKFVV